MKNFAPKPPFRGASLVEAMVAIGVLAVAAPLTLAALNQAGGSGNSSRAETRAPGIVENCLAEIRSARKGTSPNLATLEAGKAFGEGETLCLAFDGTGQLIGPVKGAGYENGVGKLGSRDVTYLATLSGQLTPGPNNTPLLTVTIGVEYPAVVREAKRRRMEFLTRLP